MDDSLERLKARLERRRLAAEEHIETTPGAISLGAAVYPPGVNEMFADDWRMRLEPDDPIRVAAIADGSIREYGTEESLAATKAAHEACLKVAYGIEIS